MGITLVSDRMSVILEPAFGARITALTDQRTGRQWLVDGLCMGGASDEATYLEAEARGWDECFPTVAPCFHPGWGQLRDHGVLWGRPWKVTSDPSAERCTTVYADQRFMFERCLLLEGAVLTAHYAVTSYGEVRTPYMWSQHALLATTPQDRLMLDGIVSMVSGVTHFAWPNHPARQLSGIGAANEGFALKSYATTPWGASAAVIGPQGGISFSWSSQVPAFGLWLDYGGWPEEAPIHQIALEPTTATADHLVAAETKGQARWLGPNDTHQWTVRVTLTGPEDQGKEP